MREGIRGLKHFRADSGPSGQLEAINHRSAPIEAARSCSLETAQDRFSIDPDQRCSQQIELCM